jgi:hypothetical protein
MEEKEKKELITKILNVDNDPKMSRVAVTVFINKATQEEARYFLDYLNHHSPAVKKIARSIVGQKTIVEALKPLFREFYNVVGSLNFMPDEEYKESHYYPNLIEILETIFNICREKCISDKDFYTRVVQIFKNTRNEDLRFTLIKLLGLMGGQFDYFLEIYDDTTEKERRALYYVYTIVEEPGRLEIYKKGLEDDRNFEYVISNMLSFEEGRLALSETLLSLGSLKKQTVLKKLQQTEGKYPEFNNVLIKLLSDKNKFLAELAIENLKTSPSFLLELDPFIEMMETGNSPEGIRGAMEIITHFVKKNPENIYLKGLEQQPSHRNKHVILEFFLKELKNNIRQTEELTEKVLPQLLVFFDNYSKEKEELFISIFKIIPVLKFPSGAKIRAVKKKIITFEQEFEEQFSHTFMNNLDEFLVKVNHMATRFEETESKLKNIKVVFDIDPTQIDHERLMKLKQQLEEIDDLDKETHAKLVQFLLTMYEAGIDWKIKTTTIELLGEYGGIKEIPKLSQVAEKESSLAVKINAQKAIKKIEEKHADAIQSVLILEPLFYIRKKLSEFFKSQAFRVFNLTEVERFGEIITKPFRFLVISDSLLDEGFTRQVFDYMDTNLDTILIIVTANPDSLDIFKEIPNIRFLKKPFNDDLLQEVITEN